MDFTTLWLGLSQLNQKEQEDFMARIPFNSPLVELLQEKIDVQFELPDDKKAESHFEAILGQMELHEWFEERNNTKDNILLKLSQVQTLPTLSTIAAQVFNAASDPNSSASSLTKVIQNDPALTAKLLKIVNSAFYGFQKKISTIEKTVVILGVEQVMDLAFGLAASKVFNVSSSIGGYNPQILWHHSLCIALIAQHICLQFPELQKLGAFTAGLLHDFGKIFLMDNFSEKYTEIYNDAEKYDIPIYELEEEKFGINHATIGQLLAEGWNLPEHLVEAIGFHHRPTGAPNHTRLAAIVGLADYLHYKAILTGSLDSEDINVASSQLTYGHWILLNQIFKDLHIDQLKEKADNVASIINNNQALFNLLD